ncbi:MAG: SufD family Fe-S cluster assembly protein, partial [Pyrobaculum sp.]
MASPSWLEEVRHRARRALDRPALYGPDIDVASFGEGQGPVEEGTATSIAWRVGVSTGAAAFYIQADNAYFRYLSRIPGVEVYRLEEFIEEHRDTA